MSAVFANPAMRKLQLALGGSTIGDWAYATALAVFIFETDGAVVLGVVSVIRYTAVAVIGPFTAALADKFDRRMVMIWSESLRGILMLVGALVIMADGAPMVVYGLAILTSIAATPFRPAQAALLPSLSRSPDELTAANVASSTIESVSSFIGPAIGAALIAWVGVEAAYLANALSSVWLTVLVASIRPIARDEDPAAESSDEDESEHRTALQEALAGFTTIFRSGDLRLVMGLYTVQTIIAGASAVFSIVIVVELLDTTAAGVGILDAVLGVGGILGAVIALVLAQRRRLAQDFGVGVILWGAPLLLVVASPEWAPTLVAMFLIGVGNSIVDINAITIIQRVTPDETMGRVFGALDSAVVGGMAVGVIATPLSIEAIGVRPTLAIIAALTVAATAAGWAGLRRIDQQFLPPRLVPLLRQVSFFAVLPEAMVERLAGEAVEVTVTAGSIVIEAGQVGDRYYVIESGEADVAGTVLGPGEGFGEIALLRDVPRTATVTARTDLVLQAITREDFLAAVTGHGDAAAEAEAVATARLTQLRSL
jgi:MFS family permease